MLHNWIVYLRNGKILDIKSNERPIVPNTRSVFKVKERTKWPKELAVIEKED